MRWIETRHLEEWANRTDARDRLGELLARLLRSSVSSATAIRFPSGDDAQIPGFDGILTAFPADGFERFVPSNESVWEFGVNQNYLQKADGDYLIRTRPDEAPQRSNRPRSARRISPSTEMIDRSKATFVFVTPRRWDRRDPTLDEWVRGKKAEGIWDDVRVLDGVGLADWLEQSPAVAAAVAREVVGNYPFHGAYSTDEFWNEYSRQFKPSLHETVVLAGRETQAAQLLQSLSAGEQLLRWKGDFLDEPVAFAIAAIRKAEPQVRRHLEARTMVLDTKEAARQLSGQPNLIFITRENASELAGPLSEKNTVVVPIGRESRSMTEAITLERPTTDQMAEALAEMALAPDQPRRLARETGRSLAVLARRIASADAKTPAWANDLNLIPALIAGAWDSGSQHDRTIVARLASTSEYSLYESKIRGYLSKDDAPLERKGNVWVIRAPVDLFVYLAIHLGSEHRDLLAEVAEEIFKEIDPALVLLPGERYLAPVRGAIQQYSTWLRDGIATTLLIFAALGEAVNLSFDGESPQQFVNRVISSIPGLRDDPRVMASISDQLPLLVEAAPDPLLSALERMLKGSGEKAKTLFQDAKSDTFLGASSPHTGVLWALEVAAWDPSLLGRTISILAGLAEIDPGGRLANRPLNSLRQILLPWHPETNASMQQRIAALDHVLSAYPSVGWRLLIQLLPRGYDVGGHSPKPKYKEAGASSREVVTRGLLLETYHQLIPRALSLADSPAKWDEILKIVHAFPLNLQEQTISALERWASRLDPGEARVAWDIIHKAVQHYSAFPSAEWSLRADLRERLIALADRLAPTDPIAASEWLFTEGLPQIERMTDGDVWERIETLRRQSVQEVFAKMGLGGVLSLAESVEAPRYVGYSFGEIAYDADVALDAVKRALAVWPRLSPFVEWVSSVAAKRFGDNWKIIIRTAFESEGWTINQLTNILIAWPHTRDTWTFVESFGEEAKLNYWRSRPAFGIEASGWDLEYAVINYVDVDRPEFVIDWLPSRLGELPSKLILAVLDKFYDRLNKVPNLLNSSIGWDLQQFFITLANRGDVSLAERAKREYAFLPFLRYLDTHERTTLALDQALADDAEFFIKIIGNVYRAATTDPDNLPPLTEQQRNKASWGWQLLEGFRVVPGMTRGKLNVEKLRSWVADVRRLAKQTDRLSVSEQKIGNVLANVPNDLVDGIWPMIDLRELLEEWQAPEIERGILIGRLNQRGGTSRSMYEGGVQERKLANSFRNDAARIARWPRSQSLLVKLAEIYEEDAKREDTLAEQNRLRDR